MKIAWIHGGEREEKSKKFSERMRMSCFWNLIKQAQAVAREMSSSQRYMMVKTFFNKIYYERKYLWKSQQNCDFIIFVAFIITTLNSFTLCCRRLFVVNEATKQSRRIFELSALCRVL